MIRITFFILAGLLLISCKNDHQVNENIATNDGGDKLSRVLSENTLDVRFIVFGDPHFDVEWDNWLHVTSHLQNEEKLDWIVDNINSTCEWLADNGPGCTGIVSVGDMIRGIHFAHSLDQYRARYDLDYAIENKFFPYVNYQVFPNIGNHDDYSEWRLNKDVGDDDAWLPLEHVISRVKGSEALFQGVDGNGDPISNYHSSDYGPNYAWEWGDFHFIHLGMWAFYGGYSNEPASTRSRVDQPKIAWLQEHLKAIGKEKPIVLFQHFGWDTTSLGEINAAGGSEWWTDDNIDMLADVLCDRPIQRVDWAESCDNGYNIVGIFSGHAHEFGKVDNICAAGEYQVSKDPGEQKWISCREHLPINNYIVDDAGRNAPSGYFVVRLTLDAQGNGTMKVEKVMLTDWDGSNYKRSVQDHPIVDFTSKLFFSWDQGQPDNGGASSWDGGEDCAVIKANGRYNDYICKEPRHLLCKDSGGNWHVSASGDYSWNDGFLHCSHSGQIFDEPKSLEEQAEIIDLLHNNGVAEAWINYTDLLKEGDWQEGQPYLAYFGNGEPNNGEDRFERGWGQNCAAIMRDGTIHDFSCEEALDHFLCYDGTDWNVTKKSPGDWKAGRNVCSSYAGQGLDLNDPEIMGSMVDFAKEYFQSHPDLKAIWVPFNDLDEEGAWTTENPWIATIREDTNHTGGWAANQPDGGTTQNCAIKMHDNDNAPGWHDAECEQPLESWPFACRNYETGDWSITTKTSKNWIDGFEYCRTQYAGQPDRFQWYFATPIRNSDNDRLKSLQGTKGVERVWLNYTDAPSDSGEDMEGFWRHDYWKKWGTNEPDPINGEDENCAAILVTHDDYSNFWFDDVCSLRMLIPCRSLIDDPGFGVWVPESGGAGSWDQGPVLCPPYTKFTYPTCPSELKDMNEAFYINRYWIPFHDTYHEGYFRPR